MTDEPFSSTIAGGAIVGLGVVALLIVGPLWGGYVLECLWNWFAAPFTPIKLTLPLAIGITCLLSIFRGSKWTKYDKEDGGKPLIYAFLNPGFLLLIGYVAHRFMAAQ